MGHFSAALGVAIASSSFAKQQVVDLVEKQSSQWKMFC